MFQTQWVSTSSVKNVTSARSPHKSQIFEFRDTISHEGDVVAKLRCSIIFIAGLDCYLRTIEYVTQTDNSVKMVSSAYA